MRWKTGVFCCGVVVAALAFAGSRPEPKKAADAKVEDEVYKIFSTRKVWGKGFARNARYLPSWTEIGQNRVTVFRDKVVGDTPYKNEGEARDAVEKLQRTLVGSRREFTRRFSDMFGKDWGPPPKEWEPPRVEVIDFFPDDDSTRVGWKSNKELLLPKDLPMDEIYLHFGKPQRTTRKVLRSEEGGDRPVVLTLHHYAQGTVIYAESDLAARPGTVDRVILDIPRLKKIMFKEGK